MAHLKPITNSSVAFFSVASTQGQASYQSLTCGPFDATSGSSLIFFRPAKRSLQRKSAKGDAVKFLPLTDYEIISVTGV